MGVKIWTLILKEEQGLKVFEKRVLRRTFGPKELKWQGLQKTA
jgi:hypothetical protein